MNEISMKKSIDEIIDILVLKIPRIEKELYYETIQNVMIMIETYQKSMISIFDEIDEVSGTIYKVLIDEWVLIVEDLHT